MKEREKGGAGNIGEREYEKGERKRQGIGREIETKSKRPN